MASVTLIGAPIEEGSGRRGCSMGPTALRIAGIDRVLESLGFTVHDTGDLRPEPAVEFSAEAALKHLPVVAAYTRALDAATYAAAQSGSVPIILGGDHALSMGSVSGMARHAEAAGVRSSCSGSMPTPISTPRPPPPPAICMACRSRSSAASPAFPQSCPKTGPRWRRPASTRSASARSTRRSGARSPPRRPGLRYARSGRERSGRHGARGPVRGRGGERPPACLLRSRFPRSDIGPVVGTTVPGGAPSARRI